MIYAERRKFFLPDGMVQNFLMIWETISYKKLFGFFGIEAILGAQYYCDVLEQGLLDAANATLKDV